VAVSGLAESPRRRHDPSRQTLSAVPLRGPFASAPVRLCPGPSWDESRLPWKTAGKRTFAALVRRRRPVLRLIQRLARKVDATIGRLAKQGDGLRSVAGAAFTIEQHHRQVVLTERRAALSSDLEVTPRLDVVAHEPRRPALHDLLF